MKKGGKKGRMGRREGSEKEESVYEIKSSGSFVIEGSLSEQAGEVIALDLACDHKFVPAESGDMSSSDSRSLCAIIHRIEIF
ncbi:MAG: hypothetical protein CL908_12860 [Deltaproteobacteria bacterium]|nr:hypothetical protein [Deltaproteobacteria bacterium]